MKRSWRASGVGEESQEINSTLNNLSSSSNGDRPREGNGNGNRNGRNPKAPRSQSFGSTSISRGHGAGGSTFTDLAQSNSVESATSFGSSRPNPASRSLSGPHSPPQYPPRSAVSSNMTLDQQKLAAIQEALPAVTRKVTACAACR